jgi:transposase
MMKIDSISINKTIEQTKALLEKDKGISIALRAVINVLLMIVGIMSERLFLNSSNSSKPPSTDPNRKKKDKDTSENKEDKKKPGGQLGRTGKTLEPVSNPDKIHKIKVDRKALPKGRYDVVGYEARQIMDIEIKRVVTEYRAEILKNSATGKRYMLIGVQK